MSDQASEWRGVKEAPLEKRIYKNGVLDHCMVIDTPRIGWDVSERVSSDIFRSWELVLDSNHEGQWVT